MSRAGWMRVLVGAGLVLGLCGCSEREQPSRSPVASANDPSPGRILYLTYCQGCHGFSGHGDGPAAASLSRPPADLTRLFERYGTPLDREPIEAYIDGRQLLESHPAREMPLWGEEFFDDVPPTTPHVEHVKRRLIEVLVDYIETLQNERPT